MKQQIEEAINHYNRLYNKSKSDFMKATYIEFIKILSGILKASIEENKNHKAQLENSAKMANLTTKILKAVIQKNYKRTVSHAMDNVRKYEDLDHTKAILQELKNDIDIINKEDLIF